MKSVRAMFAEIQAEFAGLHSRLSENPIPQISLELTFEAQPGLILPVSATLEGDELGLSVGSSFFCEWFPCSDSGVADRFRQCLQGVLSGRLRLVESVRRGHVVKAQLQDCERGHGKPVATWSKLRWPSLGRPEVRTFRNRPPRS